MFERSVLLGFMRLHILHHAGEERGVYGVWMIRELKRHGYTIGPGTLYPMLHEMERTGLLSSKKETVGGKVRKVYSSTRKGTAMMEKLREYISELAREVVV